MKAMIDTGANRSLLPESVAQRIGLEFLVTGLGSGATSEEPEPMGIYSADITIHGVGDFPAVPVMAVDHPYMSFFTLIVGNDILKDCYFAVDGPAAMFRLDHATVLKNSQ